MTSIGKVAFIGAGELATALMEGLIAAGVEAKELWCCDRKGLRGPILAGRLAVRYEADREKLLEGARFILLAVKPGAIPEAVDSIAPFIGRDALVVSLAAGVPTTAIAERLPPSARVVRVMPSLAAKVRASASVLAVGAHLEEEDLARVEELFGFVGTVTRVEEAQFDGAMAIAACGPAFLYLVAEALADGGVRVGLPRAIAARLSAQAMSGAGRMLLESSEHPARLREQVATPGGATIAGLTALEARGTRMAFIEAVSDAVERAQHLATRGSIPWRTK